MSQLTKEWSEYSGQYEKRVQDIRLKDGRELMHCWPNAGEWDYMRANNMKSIPNSEVTHTRLNAGFYGEDD